MKKINKSICMGITIIMFMAFVLSVRTLADTEESVNNEDYSEETVIETDSDKLLEKSIKDNLKAIGNNYPIVLVHGLFGWGNNELYGMSYWGEKENIRDMLNDEGYEVYTPTIGPISSNWDRACELYAYLKGGTVDYGEAHSRENGHNRFGRTFKGVLPDLGTYDENGDIKKVHLLGHSMGGETIRVLAQLLEQGSPEEMAVTGENTNPLFAGDKHWIENITTLCTPNDGSQEADRLTSFEPAIHNFFAAYASYSGSNMKGKKLDLQMDQWGLKQGENESYESYIKRVVDSDVWKKIKDISLRDLSLEGARELNSWVKTQDDIYYFSIACVDTHKCIFNNNQVPNINMFPLFWEPSTYMGKFTINEPGKVVVNQDWWRNDGMVSVRSSKGPHEGSTDKIIDYTGSAQKGVWNFLGEIKNVDHFEVVSQQRFFHRSYLQNKFRTWAKLLSEL